MHITQRTIGRIYPPEKGNRVVYDGDVTGFGVRITVAGAISFVLRYVLYFRESRLIIGTYMHWPFNHLQEID